MALVEKGMEKSSTNIQKIFYKTAFFEGVLV
jgi:hypothetical protein